MPSDSGFVRNRWFSMACWGSVFGRTSVVRWPEGQLLSCHLSHRLHCQKVYLAFSRKQYPRKHRLLQFLPHLLSVCCSLPLYDVSTELGSSDSLEFNRYESSHSSLWRSTGFSCHSCHVLDIGFIFVDIIPLISYPYIEILFYLSANDENIIHRLANTADNCCLDLQLVGTFRQMA